MAAVDKPTPSAPVSRFFAYAVAHPEDPWLFWGEGWDWRWQSFGRATAEVRRLREVLRRGEHGSAEGGGPFAFWLDLARQLDEAPAIGARRAELARAVAEALPPLGLRNQSRSRREIVVVGAPPSNQQELIGELAIHSWALSEGAAQVFEPTAALLAATAIWVRPTMFAGSVEQVRDFGRRFRAAKRRRLTRLRAVAFWGGSLDSDEIESWRGGGVETVDLNFGTHFS